MANEDKSLQTEVQVGTSTSTFWQRRLNPVTTMTKPIFPRFRLLYFGGLYTCRYIRVYSTIHSYIGIGGIPLYGERLPVFVLRIPLCWCIGPLLAAQKISHRLFDLIAFYYCDDSGDAAAPTTATAAAAVTYHFLREIK